MSALAKPTFFFSTAVGTGASDVLINAEAISTVEKVNLGAIRSDKAKSQILVVMASPLAGSSKVFTFADATARDTAFAALKTLISASV